MVCSINLWVASADKGNPAVTDKLEWARSQRAKGLPTIPSTIGVRILLSAPKAKSSPAAHIYIHIF